MRTSISAVKQFARGPLVDGNQRDDPPVIRYLGRVRRLPAARDLALLPLE